MEVKQRRQSQLFTMPLLQEEIPSSTVEPATHSNPQFLPGASLGTPAPPFATTSPDPLIRNRRRRLSAPLQDTTLHNVIKSADTSSIISIKQLATKPSRQSLCHIPLPVIENNDKLPNVAALTKENCGVSVTVDILNHREFIPRAPKRSRNSLNNLEEQPLVLNHTTLLEESPFACTPPAQIVVMSNTLQHVQALVHSYTSTETNSAGKDIEALTGYVLSSPTIDPVLPYQAPDKAAIYQRLGPQLKQMDEYKSKQTKLVENIIDARGEKGRGGMKYYCVSNGQRISSAEYEKRYRVMLEEVHKVQSHAWKVYFQNLGQCSAKNVADDCCRATAEDESEAFAPCSPAMNITPFPCRDKVSLDPEIAKAEAVLWKTIDQALATYSETVLAVAKRKQISVV